MGHSREQYIPALGYHQLTSLYDPLVALTTRERTFKQRLIRRAGLENGHHVLDLGCGTGTLAVWVKQLTPRARVVGIDADQQVLSLARVKARQAEIEVEFVRGLSTALPYPNDTFHRVLSSLFFHHLGTQDKIRTVREVYRVLKPDGQFYVADWGKPGNIIMRLLFYSIQVLDGFENTRDNVEGRLPLLFQEGGFEHVSLCGEIPTIFGTMSLYQAHKRSNHGASTA